MLKSGVQRLQVLQSPDEQARTHEQDEAQRNLRSHDRGQQPSAQGVPTHGLERIHWCLSRRLPCRSETEQHGCRARQHESKHQNLRVGGQIEHDLQWPG